MAQGVFAITEHRDGELRKVSFEAVSEGRRVADGLGTELTAVVLGSGIDGLAEELKKYGPDKFWLVMTRLWPITPPMRTPMSWPILFNHRIRRLLLPAHRLKARIFRVVWQPGWMPAWPWIAWR